MVDGRARFGQTQVASAVIRRRLACGAATLCGGCLGRWRRAAGDDLQQGSGVTEGCAVATRGFRVDPLLYAQWLPGK